MTYDEAIQAKAEIDQAVVLYRNDPRFRAMAESTTHLVTADLRGIDMTKPDQAAHRIALTAALTMLARVYWRDAEIAQLREEREIYKKAALDAVMWKPLQSTFRAELNAADDNAAYASERLADR